METLMPDESPRIDFQKIWRAVLWAIFFGAVFFFSLNAFKESDSFYHLKTGQVIWESHLIPRGDVFSYTAAGAPWILHEWLAEVFFYLIFFVSGFWGVMVSVAGLSALTVFLMLRVARIRGSDGYLPAAIFIIAGLLTFELWIARPQVLSFLFLAALLSVLERYRTGGERWRLAAALFILLVWANSHASVVLGLAVLFLYAGMAKAKIYALSRCNLKKIRALYEESDQSEVRRGVFLIAAALLGVLVCFLNPQGYKIFLYRFSIGNAVDALRVMEWQPITAFFSLYQTKLFILLMAVVDGVVAWWYGARRESRDGGVLLLVAGATVLPFLSIRYVGYFSILTLPFFAVPIVAISRERFHRMAGASALILWSIAAVFLFVVALGRVPHRYFNDQTVPVYAADFMERENISGPLFNLYNEGGYYLFRGHKVFIDGRSEVYGSSQIKELFTIVNASSGFDELVNKKYRINAFALAYRPEILADAVRPLVAKLFEEHFALVYWDDAALIFVRSTPQNAALIRRYGIQYVNPFRTPGNIPEQFIRPALAELKALIERSPANQVIQAYASALLPSAYFQSGR